MLLTSMSKNIQASREVNKVEDLQGKAENNQPLKFFIDVPSELNKIQSRSMQVWYWDGIGFDTNGKCHKFIYTYKFFPGERMWKVQTGERAPFWHMLLTRSNGK